MNRSYDIAVIAPCPIGLEIENGWFDRIKVIDDLIVEQSRIYFRVCPENDKPIEESIIHHNDLASEVYMNFNKQDHLSYFSSMIDEVNILYVHTLHYAEYALPHLSSNKVIVDIHGVTPEEEAMMGNSELVSHYETIEQEVLKHALYCVMVTQSMAEHYRSKYPNLSPRLMILPIIQNYPLPPIERTQKRNEELPVNVIYAGGLQAWQQVPKMLDAAKMTSEFACYRFFSADWEQLKKEAKSYQIADHVTFGYANKTELSEHYSEADFGFILREDCAVNRVACPTKLYDYMWYGIIPITDTPHLGDFEAYGYAHISQEDFLSGFFPDYNSRKWMREVNFKIANQMQQTFEKSSVEIKKSLSTKREKIS